MRLRFLKQTNFTSMMILEDDAGNQIYKQEIHHAKLMEMIVNLQGHLNNSDIKTTEFDLVNVHQAWLMSFESIPQR